MIDWCLYIAFMSLLAFCGVVASYSLWLTITGRRTISQRVALWMFAKREHFRAGMMFGVLFGFVAGLIIGILFGHWAWPVTL